MGARFRGQASTGFLYKILTVEFLHKIREQIKFSSIDDLKSQIKNDQKLAKDLIKNYE